MQDVRELQVQLNQVINRYLNERLGVDLDKLTENDGANLDQILVDLTANINLYQGTAAPTKPADAPQGFFSSLVSTASAYVPTSVSDAAQWTANAAKYWLGKDSSYRLQTLSFLLWMKRELASYEKDYKKVKSTEDLSALQAKMSREITAFFSAIQRILDTTADENSGFPLERNKQEFKIYGLKNNPSLLGILFKELLQSKFDCATVITNITRDLDKLRTGLPSESPAAVQKLEQEKRSLLQQLEETHNVVVSLKSELNETHTHQEQLGEELHLKAVQQETYERRIERLTQEKQSLEQKRKLEAAEREKQAILAEKKRLEDVMKQEQEQKNKLLAQLDSAHKANMHIAEVTQQHSAIIEVQASSSDYEEEQYVDPNDDVDIDVNLLSAHLRTYQAAAVQTDIPPEEIQDAVSPDHREEVEPDDSDDIDVAALSARLREHSQAPKKPTRVIVKKDFPILGKEFKQGLTLAQTHVTNGDIDKLKTLLAGNPKLVDTVCDAKGKLSKKSLIELALLHNRHIKFKTRLAILRLILSYRPCITTTTRDDTPTVLDAIKYRVGEKNQKCHMSIPDRHNELAEMFCQYAIAERTCPAEARDDMEARLANIENSYQQLSRNKAYAQLLGKFTQPLRICRLLQQAYLRGSYSVLDPDFKKFRPLDYPELYEILFTPSKKVAAAAQHENKFDSKTLRGVLLELLEPSIAFCIAAKTKKPTRVFERTDGTHTQDSNVDYSALPGKATNRKPSEWDVLAPEDVKPFEMLVNGLYAVLDLWGIPLDARNFNSYQRDEIKRQIESENAIAKVQELAQVKSFNK